MKNALTTDELKRSLMAARRRLLAIEARDDLITFMRLMAPDTEDPDDPTKSRYEVQPHHQLLADALMKVAAGEIPNLAISLPPQTGKSTLATRGFMPWYWGKFPTKSMMMGGYAQAFVESEFGSAIRATVESSQYQQIFPGVTFKPGSRSKEHMELEQGGKLSLLGRGGSGTGRPADGGFLIDDPIKDAKEADSVTIRNDVWNWFTRVVETRCNFWSWKIIIQTRWHEDDLIGRLTDPQNPHYDKHIADQWVYINIPLLMDNPEIAAALGKKVGDPLWPERFPLKLIENRRRMDPIGFSALCQGRPTPPEGAFYKRQQLFGYMPDDMPKNARYYITGDLAVSTERKGNKTCVGLWLLDENDTLYLAPDLYWDKKQADESVDEIIAICQRWPVFEGWFEKHQLERAIGPFLRKRMEEEQLYTPFGSLTLNGSKGARAISIRGRMAQGKVRFPMFAPWWPQAQDQLLKFTGSGDDAEDDFCDMLSLMGQAMDEQIAPSHLVERKDNVIKVGTMRWIKDSARRLSEEQRLRAAISGM
jgi:predicted phage terminase large subunit-like protein